MLKQGVRPARSRSQTNKFLGQNREAITEGNLPVTTTIAESYAFPAAHAARGRSASPRCSRRRTASGGACGISPFWRRSCVRTPWAPRRESRSVWFDNGVRSIETTYRVPPPGTGDVGAAGSRTFGCRSRSSSAGPWWGQLLFTGPCCVRWAFPALDWTIRFFRSTSLPIFSSSLRAVLGISYAQRRNDETDRKSLLIRPSTIEIIYVVVN
jgi:hypothetical protein